MKIHGDDKTLLVWLFQALNVSNQFPRTELLKLGQRSAARLWSSRVLEVSLYNVVSSAWILTNDRSIVLDRSFVQEGVTEKRSLLDACLNHVGL